MTQRSMSRRSVIAAGVVATAAAANVGSASVVTAAAPSDANDPRGDTESVGEVRRQEVLSTVVAGEQVLFIASSSMAPNGPAAGVSSVFLISGVYPAGPAGSKYLSASINVPLGSRLTNIEWVISGSPQAGRVALLKWIPDSATGFTVLASADISGSPTGRTVYSSAIPSGGGTEIYDGSQTYEAYYRLTGAEVTSSIDGVRVRYLPPGNALVPITPVRVYDSRLNMAPDANGPLSSGANRTVSVANTRDVTTGVATGTAVPANATAIAYTLTVADTTAQGFLAVNPGGNTVVSASSINWKAAGQEIANTGVVKLGPNRTITAIAGGGGTTNFIIDIVGYYL